MIYILFNQGLIKCGIVTVGIDPYVKWYMLVFTYKWITMDRVWNTQEDDHAPFWFTMLFFTRTDRQAFIPPIVVHKTSEWSEYVGMNLPGHWVVHNTPSGYMDINGWLKITLSFTRLIGSS